MAVYILRRTLISLSPKKQLSKFINASNIIIPSFPVISSSFSTLVTPTEEPPSSEINNYLITHHKFSPNTALKASKLSDFSRDYKKCDLNLDYFKSLGFSDTQLEELVLCDPNVLVVDLNKRIKPRVEKIIDLGFTDIELVNLLCTVPGILTWNKHDDAIASAISLLQSVLDSNADVVRLLRTSNWYLNRDLKNVFLPNIKLMEDCGVDKSQIRRMLISFPRLFLIKPESMRECMRRADEMGASRNSNLYIHCVRVLSSMSLESWDSKLNLLRKLGFSEQDILYVFRTRPNVLAVSERKLLEISKLLLSSEGLGVDLSYIIQNAEILIYSATARIKPRLEIINALVLKGLLTAVPKMTTLCRMPDGIFVRKYVLPYADKIGEVGERFVARRLGKNKSVTALMNE